MVIEALKVKQRAEGLTDTQMAKALCISRGYWNNLKNGKAKENDRFIMRAYRVYPDIFLPNDITKVKVDVTDVSQNDPPNPCSQNSGGLWGRVISSIKGLRK